MINNIHFSIVTDYADGGDVYSKIVQHQKASKFIKENDIWRILIGATRGLRALHDLGIFHRDVKSANVFLTSSGDVKLGDLNVSKVAKQGLLETQTGTPYYASPEVWKDMPYDSKSDMWGLGCVIYEMAKLKPPFRGADMSALFRKVTEERFERIPPHFSRDLSAVLEWLLEKNPLHRPSAKMLDESIVPRQYNDEDGNERTDFKTNESVSNTFDKGEGLLLKTIRFSNEMMDIAKQLPLSNYENKSLKEIQELQLQHQKIGWQFEKKINVDAPLSPVSHTFKHPTLGSTRGDVAPPSIMNERKTNKTTNTISPERNRSDATNSVSSCSTAHAVYNPEISSTHKTKHNLDEAVPDNCQQMQQVVTEVAATISTNDKSSLVLKNSKLQQQKIKDDLTLNSANMSMSPNIEKITKNLPSNHPENLVKPASVNQKSIPNLIVDSSTTAAESNTNPLLLRNILSSILSPSRLVPVSPPASQPSVSLTPSPKSLADPAITPTLDVSHLSPSRRLSPIRGLFESPSGKLCSPMMLYQQQKQSQKKEMKNNSLAAINLDTNNNSNNNDGGMNANSSILSSPSPVRPSHFPITGGASPDYSSMKPPQLSSQIYQKTSPTQKQGLSNVIKSQKEIPPSLPSNPHQKLGGSPTGPPVSRIPSLLANHPRPQQGGGGSLPSPSRLAMPLEPLASPPSPTHNYKKILSTSPLKRKPTVVSSSTPQPNLDSILNTFKKSSPPIGGGVAGSGGVLPARQAIMGIGKGGHVNNDGIDMNDIQNNHQIHVNKGYNININGNLNGSKSGISPNRKMLLPLIGNNSGIGKDNNVFQGESLIQRRIKSLPRNVKTDNLFDFS